MPASTRTSSHPSLFTVSLIAAMVAALGLLPLMAQAQSGGSQTQPDTTRPAPASDMNDADADRATTGTSGTALMEMLRDDGKYSTFVGAMESTGLAKALGNGGPYTVFAPTDEAFQAVDADLDAMSRDELVRILRQHIVVDEVSAETLAGLSAVRVVTGDTLTVGSDGSTIGGASITATDMTASNGVSHGIDTVLMPKNDTAAPATMDRSDRDAGDMPKPADRPSRDTTEEDTTESDTLTSQASLRTVRVDTTESDTVETDSTEADTTDINSLTLETADAGLLR